ncbi:hypothetical protein CEP54_014055 [Fusarium duplospermum]|uniref:Uncharacterized protein n=1 Tax=Fusarium duplospermum TaxID=1325734 RepID=A0A428NZ30_9HYPO|nr:hypothetical protein CEP54_014055 [Fusarium duplospermum]
MNVASFLTEKDRDMKEAALQDSGPDGSKQPVMEEGESMTPTLLPSESVSEFASGSLTSERAFFDLFPQAVKHQHDQPFLPGADIIRHQRLNFLLKGVREKQWQYSLLQLGGEAICSGHNACPGGAP